jgi:hypothetical protein
MRRDRRSVIIRQAAVAVIFFGGVALGLALDSVVVTVIAVFVGIILLLALMEARG